MTSRLNDLALLRLLHLVSPALPIGGYSYSQGLEFAIDADWLSSEAEVESWISGMLESSLGYLDLPVLLRCYHAWQQEDQAALVYWNDFLRASRETSELLLEDEQLGMALQRLLRSLELSGADREWQANVGLVPMFALAGVRWNVECASLLQGFAWSWLENQVAAATKLVPFGQTQAQKILTRLMEKIPGTVSSAQLLDDHELGLSLPGLALSSARHERQYSRLFRS